MLVIPLGNEVKARFVQSLNAYCPILVTPLGNEVKAIFLQ